METIEQEKFLRNMPKALDDRIVQQVGRNDQSFKRLIQGFQMIGGI